MTNLWLVGAAGTLVGIGALHSWLGERLLLGPIFARLAGRGRLDPVFERRVLRFAWHVTSLAWWGFAAIAFVLSSAPLDSGARIALWITAALLGVTSVYVGLASRGAHFAWPVFAVTAGLIARGVADPNWAHVSGAAVVASMLVAVSTAALALLHAYWALRRQSATRSKTITIPETRDGRPVFRPGRGGTLLVAALLSTVGVAALHAGGVVDLPLSRTFSRVVVALAALVFFGRTIGDFRYIGLFKRIQTTPFGRWDTRLFTPMCFALGTLLTIELG